MYVPTTVVVAVAIVVDGFMAGKFWFFAPPPYAVMAGIGPDFISFILRYLYRVSIQHKVTLIYKLLRYKGIATKLELQ